MGISLALPGFGNSRIPMGHYICLASKLSPNKIINICLISAVSRYLYYISIGWLIPLNSKILKRWWPPLSWSYGSLAYNYLCNQYLSPLTLWVQIPLMVRCTLCDKVSQWLAAGQWFSPVLRFPPPIKLSTTI